MKSGNEIPVLVMVLCVGVAIGFVVGELMTKCKEECHIYRDGPDKQARHCKVLYKGHKKGEK